MRTAPLRLAGLVQVAPSMCPRSRPHKGSETLREGRRATEGAEVRPGGTQRKGARLERRVAALTGGKRTPLSGGAGGNDVTHLDGSLWSFWGIESKGGRQVPVFFESAYLQAR